LICKSSNIAVDELSKLKNSVEERNLTLEKSFFEKLNENNEKISVIASETEKKISESALDFSNKNEILETEVNKKLKNTEVHLKNIDEQIENQIMSFSIQKIC